MNEQVSALCSLVWLSGCALLSVACGDGPTVEPIAIGGSSGMSGSGGAMAGSGGTPAPSVPQGTALTWNEEGFVASDTNPFRIQGPFYAYSDCVPASGLPCTAPDAALLGPDGKPGWSVNSAEACIKGTAVKVEDSMFAAQWGAGLALDLNSKGGEPGMPAEKATLDLPSAGIQGFSVDIRGTAPARIRINLTMPGVADSSFVDASIPGTTTFSIAQLKQGSWVKEKTPLDPSKIEALQFQVFTTAASPTPFDFCVTAIRVIATTPAGGAG